MIRIIFCLALAGILLPGCVSTPPPQVPIRTVDALIQAVATETIALLRDTEFTTLVVYYFTAQGEPSPLSDYLIAALNTELANRVKAEAPGVKVVSRQNLDQLIREMQFQASSLVDESTQLSLGKQLGAQVMLTGTITLISDYYKLNAQLLEVETATVTGGFVLDFQLEAELAAQIEDPGASRVFMLKTPPVSRGGIATTTTLFETFDEKVMNVQISPFSEKYGPGIKHAGSIIDLAEHSEAEQGVALEWNIEGVLAALPDEPGWEDSYLDYYLRISREQALEDFDGIALELKPRGFNFINIRLLQYEGEERIDFQVGLSLNEDQWQSVKIPFALFFSCEGELDLSAPLELELDLSYEDNFRRMAFPGTREITASLLIDNLGFYQGKGTEDPGLLESFNTEINQMLWSVSMYGAGQYVAYELIEDLDEDEAADIDIVKQVPGIGEQTLRLERVADGPEGEFLAIRLQYKVGPELRDFMETYAYYGLTLYMWCESGKSWEGYRSLNYFLKSDVFSRGSLEVALYYGDAREAWYQADVEASPFWTRISHPFASLHGEEGTLAEFSQWPVHPRLQFAFDLPREVLLDAIDTGVLEIELSFDSFYLE